MDNSASISIVSDRVLALREAKKIAIDTANAWAAKVAETAAALNEAEFILRKLQKAFEAQTQCNKGTEAQ